MGPELSVLTGILRQGDATALAADLRLRLDRGPVRLDLTGLTAVEFGPLQVLLSAAATAARRGIGFDIVASPDGALAAALSAHALEGALDGAMAPRAPTDAFGDH